MDKLRVAADTLVLTALVFNNVAIVEVVTFSLVICALALEIFVFNKLATVTSVAVAVASVERPVTRRAAAVAPVDKLRVAADTFVLIALVFNNVAIVEIVTFSLVICALVLEIFVFNKLVIVPVVNANVDVLILVATIFVVV